MKNEIMANLNRVDGRNMQLGNSLILNNEEKIKTKT